MNAVADNLISIDEALAFINPPTELTEITRRALPLVISGDPSDEVRQAFIGLFKVLPPEHIARLTELAFDPRVRCSDHVRGRILRIGWHAGSNSRTSSATGLRRDHVVRFFQQTKPHYRMFPEELAVFKDLPDTIKIYRGTQAKSAGYAASSFSWSPDIRVAKCFAHFPPSGIKTNPMVVSAHVPKLAVMSFIAADNVLRLGPDYFYQTELIVDHSLVSNVQIVPEDIDGDAGSNPIVGAYERAKRSQERLNLLNRLAGL